MRDNQRTLNSSQKQALLFGSNRICGICNEPIKPDEEIHFHHTIPHSHGGKTEIMMEPDYKKAFGELKSFVDNFSLCDVALAKIPQEGAASKLMSKN